MLLYWRLRRRLRRDTFAFQMNIGALLLPLIIPFFVEKFRLFQLSNTLVYAIALIGLNILTGINGQLSVGHGAYFGIGAFSMAIIMGTLKLHYLVALFLTLVACAFTGFVCGIPALRLQRDSLSMVTFALSVMFPQLLVHFDKWTGGSTGLTVEHPEVPGFLARFSVTQDVWMYIICLIGFYVVSYLTANLVYGRTGRALRAVRDHDIASEAMGISNAYYRVLASCLSGAVTGIGGALFALLIGRVAPDTFGAELSLLFLAAIVVGGVGSLYAPIYGAIFLQFVPNITEAISQAMTMVVYGAVMIGLVFFNASGVTGILRTTRGYSRVFLSYFKF